MGIRNPDVSGFRMVLNKLVAKLSRFLRSKRWRRRAGRKRGGGCRRQQQQQPPAADRCSIFSSARRGVCTHARHATPLSLSPWHPRPTWSRPPRMPWRPWPRSRAERPGGGCVLFFLCARRHANAGRDGPLAHAARVGAQSRHPCASHPGGRLASILGRPAAPSN